MCLDKNWTAGLVFTCDKSFGGLGNIRNSILNCVRYAIEAGGELVVPQIRLRNPSDLFDFKTETKVNMAYLFDGDYFVSALKHSCPQLKLHNSLEDVPNIANARDPVNLTPEELEKNPPMTGLARPAQWRHAFFVWLYTWAKREYGNISHASPTIIALDRSYLQFPVTTTASPSLDASDACCASVLICTSSPPKPCTPLPQRTAITSTPRCRSTGTPI
jgi:hypothetical protein